MEHSKLKKEHKKPDHWTEVARQIFYNIIQNQKMVLGIFAILLVLGGSFVAWDQFSTKKDLEIQTEYYSVEKAYLKKKEAFDKAEADKKDLAKKETGAITDKDEKKSDTISALASGDLTKDFGPEVEGWNKIINNFPGSKAAAMSALELSQLYVKYNKEEDAVQLLSKVKGQMNSDLLLGAMVFHSYANFLSKKGQCQDALPIWENLEKKKKFGFLVEQAKMGRALCLESLGQVEKAEGLLKDLVAGSAEKSKQGTPKPKSSVQRSAEKILRYLQLKKNMSEAKS